jgi:HSP20 family protein
MADSQMTTRDKSDRTEVVNKERTRAGGYYTPRVDILETEKELTLFADMPGVSPADVDLHYENGELVLHGRVGPRERKGTRLLAEYEPRDFYRAFTIHESIDNSRIEATCKNGVLTVHLPKVAAAQPKQIKVHGS